MIERRKPGSGVRPTRAVVTSLGVSLPDVGTPLEAVAHEIVEKAQDLPRLVEAKGAERVASIDDRVWFKTKTEAWRGAVTQHPVTLPGDDVALTCWWLGAAGSRQADSPQSDFYASLQRECEARRKAENGAGANHKTRAVSSHLLPAGWDADRLAAEMALHATRLLKDVVRRAASESLRSGSAMEFDFADCRVSIKIHAPNGIAYILLRAEGIVDATSFALLLDSLPGIHPDDWMPEPGGAVGLVPKRDEILWSAVLPTETQARLLDY